MGIIYNLTNYPIIRLYKPIFVGIEAEIDDMQKLDSALLALINRDNVLYRKKDIHIAMVKNFLKLIENDIGKVKIERC